MWRGIGGDYLLVHLGILDRTLVVNHTLPPNLPNFASKEFSGVGVAGKALAIAFFCPQFLAGCFFLFNKIFLIVLRCERKAVLKGGVSDPFFR
ncbi:hypothetical protein BWK47_11455 [Synechocystis sp. CACIAM 05]|nr:hypothetical protein BWK47_11455 [Synechocystis sp. CACIAM 05]